MRLFLSIVLLCLSLGLSARKVYDVTEHGAVGDGVTDNTDCLRKLIQTCAAEGGGVVLFPSGTYLTAPLALESGVELKIDYGAMLLGVDGLDRYLDEFDDKENGALVYAKGKTGVSVTGQGVVDGQGGSPDFQLGDGIIDGKRRPMLLWFYQCEDVAVKDLTLRNSAYWMQLYSRCDEVLVENLKVYNHCNHNNDGLDIDSKNVVVKGCFIDSEDDALCLKSHSLSNTVENVKVSDCVLASCCNTVKVGTASRNVFKDIDIDGIVIKRPSEVAVPHSAWVKYIPDNHVAVSGLAVEMVDGGELRDVEISNVEMSGVLAPIFIRLADRERAKFATGGVLDGVTIRGVTAVADAKIPSSITGVAGDDVPNAPLCVRNVRIEDVSCVVEGGVTDAMNVTDIKEDAHSYPEATRFGSVLPATGFYVRHVRGIEFKNVKVDALAEDVRPVIYLDDVQDASLSNVSGREGQKVSHKTESCKNVTENE